MEKMLQVRGRHISRNRPPRRWVAAGIALLFSLVLSATASAQQQIPISGTVTSAGGAPLRGVAVRVQGTDVRAVTNAQGKYSIAAPSNGILNFSIIGQRAVNENINNRTTIDVAMQPIAFLDEVVVTAYSE